MEPGDGLVALEPAKELGWPSRLVAGACAGVAVDTSLYPVDTLRTRLQVPEGKRSTPFLHADR